MIVVTSQSQFTKQKKINEHVTIHWKSFYTHKGAYSDLPPTLVDGFEEHGPAFQSMRTSQVSYNSACL